MAQFDNGIPGKAGAAVTAKRIAKVGSADGAFIQGAAATDALMGVFTYSAASGAHVTVQTSGVAMVTAGGTVTRGARITSDANGKGVVAAPAQGVNNGVVGIALTAAADGEEFDLLLAPGIMQGA